MKYVHFVMQGKGGAGKSFVSSLIAEYIKDLNTNNLVLDTDPLNQSLLKIKKLNCVFVDILDKSKEHINHNQFDIIIQKIIDSNSDHVLIDTGSSSFIQLCAYINHQNVIQTLDQLGYQCKFHFVINGGSEQQESINLTIGFASLLYDFDPEFSTNTYNDYKPLIIWLNPMPEPLKFNNPNNSFLEDPSYAALEYLVDGIINLPIYPNDRVLRDDIFTLKENCFTFAEFQEQKYIENENHYTIMAKIRVKKFKEEIDSYLEPLLNPQYN